MSLQFDEIMKRSDILVPNAGYRIRAKVHMFIRDQTGKEVAKFKLNEYTKNVLPSVWPLKEMEVIRSLLGKYEVEHPYCCLRKFLIDDYNSYGCTAMRLPAPLIGSIRCFCGVKV